MYNDTLPRMITVKTSTGFMRHVAGTADRLFVSGISLFSTACQVNLRAEGVAVVQLRGKMLTILSAPFRGTACRLPKGESVTD